VPRSDFTPDVASLLGDFAKRNPEGAHLKALLEQELRKV
jgi:hypothetical protein